MKKHIPNLITCLNVFSGSMAVIFALQGLLTTAVWWIVAAALFDFLDGMTARLLKAYSPMGKELDSLADVISFGLAPGIIMFVLQQKATTGALIPAQAYGQLTSLQLMFIFSALIIPVFSALRLAKFNIDTRQSDSFIGLPTPANALFISALGLISEHGSFPAIDHSILNSWALLAMTLLFSGLLVSEVAMFALKFKNLSWKENHIRYIFLFLSAIMVASFPIYGIAAAILLFILISVLAGKRQVNP